MTENKAQCDRKLGENCLDLTGSMQRPFLYTQAGAVNGIAGFGTLIMLVIGGPLSYGVAKLFLQQCDDGQKMNPTGNI